MKKALLSILISAILSPYLAIAKEYHVSIKGNDSYIGTFSSPFKTISKAVEHAFSGDIITVHAGVYREWVNPIRGGESDTKRIVYRAATGEKVEIKGSEIVTGWIKEKIGVWKVIIPNSFFGSYNPFKDSIYGDWFNNLGRLHHTGDVFLNGKSLFEMETKDKVFNPVANKNIKDSIGSTYTWFCESDSIHTIIWANFHTFNPNKELVEISVRRTCFYPEKPGINYITIKGFYISEAATQWAAPTAEQIGMVATHWNKGWIIKNNVIRDSKCNGITLGKDASTGHNVWSKDVGNVNRDGNIHYIEVIFRALRYGWDKEHIGSHIVRNNEIFNCEQTAICGSMGAAFSTIENNHIHDIWTKRQFTGWEIGGVKFHAPIDVALRDNCIHDCGRGLWFDWMTQGSRISGNLFFNNDMEDIFVEVSHGPYIIDNNILLSKKSFLNVSQGGAIVHNLIAGAIYNHSDDRFTPYFLPHSSDMAGLTTIYSGDDRFYNNIVIGSGNNTDDIGLMGYDNAFLPVWLDGNVYYNKAKPSSKDTHLLNDSLFNPEVKLVCVGNKIYLHFNLNKSYYNHKIELINTMLLGKAKIPKEYFEDPNGEPLVFDKDYFGEKRSLGYILAGPFSNLSAEKIKLMVWPK